MEEVLDNLLEESQRGHAVMKKSQEYEHDGAQLNDSIA